MSIIQQDSFVTMHYSISILEPKESTQNLVNTLVNTFIDETPITITIGQGMLAPTIEEYLLGKQENEEFETIIHNAFGIHNPKLQQLVSLELIKQHSKEQEFNLGDAVSFNTPKGALAGVFIQMDTNGGAWFDFNHPLAGKSIYFKAKIIGIL